MIRGSSGFSFPLLKLLRIIADFFCNKCPDKEKQDMLYYLITTTKDLLFPAVLIGMLFAFIPQSSGKKGRLILSIGTFAGIAAAIALALLKNLTKFIDKNGGTQLWNVWIFAASTLALIVFYVFSIKPLRRVTGSAGQIASSVSAAVSVFTILAYALPAVLAYPFNFTLNGASVFSTAFIYRFIGWLLGIILCLLVMLVMYQTSRRTGNGFLLIMLDLALLVNGLQQVLKAIQILNSKRIAFTGHEWFVIVKHATNYSDLFIYAMLVIALIIPVTLLIKSAHVNEPYSNPAEHRKIRAKWRNTRRWSVGVALCAVMVVMNLTVFTAIDNQEPELSPTEQCEDHGEDLYIPLTQVEDGHLHRFAYTTPDNIAVRFIIIKKPNSSSYGVGLDACDICGETGYYERNGQVVCNLCDVVMNINTIGFKGGCNPIVIDYSVANGYIIVPKSTLVEHQDEFK